MATPITAAAAAYEAYKLVRGEIGVEVEWVPLIAGMVAALLSGLLAIGFLLRYLRTRSLNVFVAYRIVLAAVVLVAFLR
jgi:undecaprenyl-diphosphatase